MATTYEPIATQTLSSTSAQIDFNSIPQTYTDLVLVTNLIVTDSGYPFMRINGNTSSIYSNTFIRGTGSAIVTSRNSNSTEWYFTTGYDTYGVPVLATINFFNYTSSTNKTGLVQNAGASQTTSPVSVSALLARTSSAITSISLIKASTTWSAGSTATLYGIKNA
jgi:hypothetical protein